MPAEVPENPAPHAGAKHAPAIPSLSLPSVAELLAASAFIVAYVALDG
jgi:hypothetical protein